MRISRLSLRAAAAAVCLWALAAGIASAQTPSCQVTYTKSWEGGNGFGANIIITNNGPAITNGTTYYYVVTALNASGESPISTQVSATPAATGGDTGGVTVTKAVTSASPWFNEIQVRLANTSPITVMTVTIVVQRTTGVSYSGAYNTVGGQITQANASTASTVTYTWTLNAGQTLNASTSRTFAAQFGGNGTAHPVTGDTWTVNYTTGGVVRTQTGTF